MGSGLVKTRTIDRPAPLRPDKNICATARGRAVALWLPVFLLPAGNLLIAMRAPGVYDPQLMLRSLIGAAVEEVLFRWILLKTMLLPRVRPAIAICATATLFAALHLLNVASGSPVSYVLVQALYAFGFSIWAGAAVWRKNSVLIPLLAHLLLNLTAGTEETLLSLAIGMIVLVDGIVLIHSSAS